MDDTMGIPYHCAACGANASEDVLAVFNGGKPTYAEDCSYCGTRNNYRNINPLTLQASAIPPGGKQVQFALALAVGGDNRLSRLLGYDSATTLYDLIDQARKSGAEAIGEGDTEGLERFIAKKVSANLNGLHVVNVLTNGEWREVDATIKMDDLVEQLATELPVAGSLYAITANVLKAQKGG
ncbi:MAG: hypothetical protein HGA85_08955 [Nanoarchaeota archaeon]|nr:hypothetical protein [Nanoarchaeota archaeon]